MKKFIRAISLLLSLLFVVAPLWSCDGGGDEGGDGGGLNDDGSVNWAEVNFNGASVKYAISVYKESGGTFAISEKYLRGADSSSTDEVVKKVIARNNKVENDLGLKVMYDEVDTASVLGDIKSKVLGSAADAPDVYNNDMSALNYALVEGYLMNVVNPKDKSGDPVASYFDFTSDAWKYDFMNELTLDKSKVYVLAGDYHIDMVRMAYVLFVNKTMFNQNATALGTDSVDTFYDYVMGGVWDYDMLTDMCDAIWQDDGSEKNKPDQNDSRLGLLVNHTVYYVFVPATGISTYFMGDDGKPKMISDIDEMNRMGQKVRDIWEAGSPPKDGIYFEHSLDCIDMFMQGNVLFAPAMLGELESDEFRAANFDKGLVPLPKYDKSRQDDYYTMMHSGAELSAILVNAPSFTRASAYLQYANEQSHDVLTEYYEFSLKFKYNDDPKIRSMIDLVYETIDSPFGMYFESVIFQYLEVENNTFNLHYAISKNMLSSFYESWKTPYQRALDRACADFAKVP